MGTKRIAVLVALLVFGLFAIGRLAEPGNTEIPNPAPISGDAVPAAEIAADIVDGRIDAQLFVATDRSYRLEIQFEPASDSPLSAATRPSVAFAMQDEHMDGISPPLQSVSNGKWRAVGELPKAGKWVVNVGIGEDFADTEFQVQ